MIVAARTTNEPAMAAAMSAVLDFRIVHAPEIGSSDISARGLPSGSANKKAGPRHVALECETPIKFVGTGIISCVTTAPDGLTIASVGIVRGLPRGSGTT